MRARKGTRRGRTRAATALAACALLAALAACEGEAPPRVERDAGGLPGAPPAAGPRRAIEPASGLATAALPRAQLGGETRTVMATLPRELVRWQEPVAVPPGARTLEPSGRVTGDVAVGEPALVTARASLEDPRLEQRTRAERGRVSAHRPVARAAPRVVVLPEDRVVSARIELPPDAIRAPSREPGTEPGSAVVDLVVRPLGVDAITRWPTREFAIRAGDRLVFGYGIEEEAWSEGFPPVRFRASAAPAAGPDAGQQSADSPVVLFERRIDPAVDARDRRWHDVSVDLSTLAGRRVRFVFEAEPLGALLDSGLARTLAVVSNPEVVAGARDLSSEAPVTRYNLLLVSLDTLRARSMGAYGHARATTPVFDARIAAQGALVRRAITPYPYTPPSHVSMLTGLDVCAHGVEGRDDVLSPDRPTLAEALRAAGYRTAAFTENGYVVAGAGFARGFDSYHELRSEETVTPGFARETFERAERWLEGADARPFFLFVHTYQVHEPYVPPRAYADLFVDEHTAQYPADRRERVDDYEREVRYTDELLAGLLDRIDALGLADRTIVAVTSDHGEQFGEHFFTGHGFDLHDEALLVPMAIRAPGLVASGVVVEEQVGLMDLPPTLLELMGVDPLPEVQGRSFASLIAAEPGAVTSSFEERPLVGKALNQRSIRTRRYKYIEGTEAEWRRVYRLEEDPLERSDVAAEAAEQIAAARRQLEAHDRACAEWLRAHPRVEPGEEGLRARPGWMIHRDEIERKLRSLGYVE